MRVRILTILIMGLISCGKVDSKKAGESEMAIQDLQLNDIVHDSLTEKQVRDIEKIHNVFSEVSTGSLEEMITNFKRDQNPDNEIAIWLKMAEAYKEFISSAGETVDHRKKDEAFEVILLRSMMEEKEVLDKIEITFLTNDEVKKILSYYNVSPQPLKVEKR